MHDHIRTVLPKCQTNGKWSEINPLYPFIMMLCLAFSIQKNDEIQIPIL